MIDSKTCLKLRFLYKYISKSFYEILMKFKDRFKSLISADVINGGGEYHRG